MPYKERVENAGFRVVESLLWEGKFYWIKESEKMFSENYFKSEQEAYEDCVYTNLDWVK